MIQYRQTKENIKREKYNQKENYINIQKKIFHKLGLEISEEEINIFKNVNHQVYNQSSNFVNETHISQPIEAIISAKDGEIDPNIILIEALTVVLDYRHKGSESIKRRLQERHINNQNPRKKQRNRWI